MTTCSDLGIPTASGPVITVTGRRATAGPPAVGPILAGLAALAAGTAREFADILGCCHLKDGVLQFPSAMIPCLTDLLAMQDIAVAVDRPQAKIPKHCDAIALPDRDRIPNWLDFRPNGTRSADRLLRETNVLDEAMLAIALIGASIRLPLLMLVPPARSRIVELELASLLSRRSLGLEIVSTGFSDAVDGIRIAPMSCSASARDKMCPSVFLTDVVSLRDVELFRFLAYGRGAAAHLVAWTGGSAIPDDVDLPLAALLGAKALAIPASATRDSGVPLVLFPQTESDAGIEQADRHVVEIIHQIRAGGGPILDALPDHMFELLMRHRRAPINVECGSAADGKRWLAVTESGSRIRKVRVVTPSISPWVASKNVLHVGQSRWSLADVDRLARRKHSGPLLMPRDRWDAPHDDAVRLLEAQWQSIP